MNNLNKILKGIPASSGVVEGTIVVIKEKEDIGKVKEGDILVISGINLKLFPILKHKASAFIAEQASINSHIATIAREAKKPCVVQVEKVTEILKTGDKVRVDGDTGSVEILEK